MKDMKDIKYYERLSENLDQSLIEKELNELINNHDKADNSFLLNALLELSDRQVINYNAIDENIKKEIAHMIISAWNKESLDNTRICISIMLNLGLQDLYNFFRKSISSVYNSDVLNELQETFSEFGDNVEDVTFK